MVVAGVLLLGAFLLLLIHFTSADPALFRVLSPREPRPPTPAERVLDRLPERFPDRIRP